MGDKRSFFELRYLIGKVPWDTGVTPPELEALVKDPAVSPGRALDLGCGTGTNVIYLARHGWQAVGVDFSLLAILQARWKAFWTRLDCRFHRSDVTNLPFLTCPFDLILDIGCLHSLSPPKRGRYVSEVERLARPGGRYMLYAFTPRPGQSSDRGVTPEEVQSRFTPAFAVERTDFGGDPTGPSSAWYWLRREGQMAPQPNT
ncbi:MAG: class I SAM-dependent methyltransferase [Anaerolineae bacterium]|jgi:SAM-dependent methyltransferase